MIIPVSLLNQLAGKKIKMAIFLTDYNLSFNPALLIAIGLGSMLYLWRLWRFGIRPHFRPDEPTELPYSIPCTCVAGFVDYGPANYICYVVIGMKNLHASA